MCVLLFIFPHRTKKQVPIDTYHLLFISSRELITFSGSTELLRDSFCLRTIVEKVIIKMTENITFSTGQTQLLYSHSKSSKNQFHQPPETLLSSQRCNTPFIHFTPQIMPSLSHGDCNHSSLSGFVSMYCAPKSKRF